jgi:hypothetical protein
MQVWTPHADTRDDGEFAVHLNPGKTDPFAVIELSEGGATSLVMQTISECDRLMAAVTRARSLLNTAREGGAS